MDFINIDDELKIYPKQITQLIFNFYTTKCNICNIIQKYCNTCKFYNCDCVKFIHRCNVKECNKILCCSVGIKISPGQPLYLCERCWNIDINKDILDDIRINGS